MPTQTPVATGITIFDSSYAGHAVVTITTSTSTPSKVSTIPTTFTVANGIGTGWASDWAISGRVTDSVGVAEVNVTNRLYGT